MPYSGAQQAANAREMLGRALAALQEDPNIPQDVLAVAENIAKAVGALFEAERASSEPDGKAGIRSALGSLSQTLALLQDVRAHHRGIGLATETLAKAMSQLYPLTTVPSRMPPPGPGQVPAFPTAQPLRRSVPEAGGVQPVQPARPVGVPAQVPQFEPQQPPHFAQPQPQSPHFAQPQPQSPHFAQPQPQFGQPQPQSPQFGQPQPPQFGQSQPQSPQFGVPPRSAQYGAPEQAHFGGPREAVEANIGATTESNFYVGFSGEVAEGGVFVATYTPVAKGTSVDLLVTLPGGFETHIPGTVRFTRDPMDLMSDSEPGMGVQFDGITAEQRELILRFIRKRAPMFYDD